MLTKVVGEPRTTVAQDGTKQRLLCNGCEQALAPSERLFREHIFLPGQDGSLEDVPYGPWLAHFVASIAWRLTVHYLQEGGFDEFPQRVRESAQRAETTWREFLLNQRSTSSPATGHIFQFPQEAAVSPVLREYVCAAIDQYPAWQQHDQNDDGIVVSKLGRIVVIGRFGSPEPQLHLWRGTVVHENGGTFSATHARLPATLWQGFREQAGQVSAMHASPVRHETMSRRRQSGA